MKKNKTLYIEFVPLKTLKKRVGEIMDKKKPYKGSRHVIEFGDSAGYNRFMNFNKEAILGAIYTSQPENIYKLSDLVDRNYASVHRDCQSLEKMGFIKLIKTKESRSQIRPELSFDYSSIQVAETGVTVQLGLHQQGQTA